MSHPPAPWNLYGKAFQSLHWIDVATAKAFVPADLEIVSVLPGKTLGGLYLSAYAANSTLEYSELIVTPALVRHQGTLGSWISHIYVDQPESMAGGRMIWGLPKEMAEFTWGDRQVQVTQNGQLLCEAHYSTGGLPLSFWGKSKISGTVLSGLDAEILAFSGNFAAKLQWISASLTISQTSPFAALKMGQPWLTLALHDLHLTANIPTVVGQWTSASRYSQVFP